MPAFVMRRWNLDPYPFPQAPLHVHDAGEEGFVVVQGELDVTLGSEVTRLGPGEFVVVPAGTPHTFATVDGIPASVVVTMTPEIDALIRELHEVPDEERPLVWGRHRSRLL
jgi:mannose-6-phosphate isomerase-like protein (cupin superfamily)